MEWVKWQIGKAEENIKELEEGSEKIVQNVLFKFSKVFSSPFIVQEDDREINFALLVPECLSF